MTARPNYALWSGVFSIKRMTPRPLLFHLLVEVDMLIHMDTDSAFTCLKNGQLSAFHEMSSFWLNHWLVDWHHDNNINSNIKVLIQPVCVDEILWQRKNATWKQIMRKFVVERRHCPPPVKINEKYRRYLHSTECHRFKTSTFVLGAQNWNSGWFKTL